MNRKIGEALTLTAPLMVAGGFYIVCRRHALQRERATRAQAAALWADEQRNLALLEASQRQARDLALINRVLVAAASAQHPNVVLETICSELARAFELPQAAAAVLDAGHDCLTVVAEYCAEGRPSALGAVIRVSENATTRAVIESGKPLAIVDAQTDPRQTAFHPLAKQRGTASLLIVPLIVDDRVVGTIGLDAIERREFSGEEIRLAEMVALAASQPLEKAYHYVDIQRELAERRQAEETRARLAAIVDWSGDAIVSIGMDGTIQSWNAAAEQICGYTAAEAIGTSILILVPQELRAQRLQLYRSVLAERRIVQTDTVWQHKDGQSINVSLTISPLAIGGELSSFAVIARDISARAHVDRLKKEFVATVSHELRTPLTSICGALGLLASGVTGELPERTKTMVDIALDNSDRLVRLINDLLDIEKIESETLAFEFAALELMPLLEAALAANHAYAGQFGVSFVLDQHVPGVMVHADADRLMQVLANILSNAAKFSPSNSLVHVAASRSDESVRVAVRDNGPGVPVEFQSRIFQKFAQADASDTRQKGGTGLGLSIAKAIVERHGGRIGYENHDHGGATFFIELPICEPTAMV